VWACVTQGTKIESNRSFTNLFVPSQRLISSGCDLFSPGFTETSCSERRENYVMFLLIVPPLWGT
jgi:hypothetical protein